MKTCNSYLTICLITMLVACGGSSGSDSEPSDNETNIDQNEAGGTDNSNNSDNPISDDGKNELIINKHLTSSLGNEDQLLQDVYPWIKNPHNYFEQYDEPNVPEGTNMAIQVVMPGEESSVYLTAWALRVYVLNSEDEIVGYSDMTRDYFFEPISVYLEINNLPADDYKIIVTSYRADCYGVDLIGEYEMVVLGVHQID